MSPSATLPQGSETKLGRSYCVYPDHSRKSVAIKKCEPPPMGRRLASLFKYVEPE